MCPARLTLSSTLPTVDPQAYDHNKDHVALWAAALASAPNTMQYLSGVAFHWYVNGAGCTIGTGDCMAEGKESTANAQVLSVDSPVC